MNEDDLRASARSPSEMFRPVAPLLRARSVALVGASDKGAWPRALHGNFRRSGFPGRIYYVNPRRDQLWDQPCYPDLASLPEAVDHAMVVVPADFVLPVLESGATRGVKTFTIFAAGFGEGQDLSGVARSNQLSEFVQRTGARICGPNCMGFISTPAQLWTYPSRRITAVPAGPVGAVFQSGGTLGYWLTHGVQRGLGFSYAISSGNELDLDLADYINFMVEDDQTRIIACLVEGIRRPIAFLEAVRKSLAAKKPVLVVKVGRTAAAQASSRSHTGALAGDDRVFDAVCHRYGIARCESLDQMLEAAVAFSSGRLPSGPKVAIVSSSGGAKGLMLDAVAREGLDLAAFSAGTAEALREWVDPVSKLENPLDTGAGAANNPKGLSAVCRTVVADDGVDLLAFLGRVPLEKDEQPDVKSFNAIVRSTDKPVYAFSQMNRTMTEAGRAYQKAAGLPFLQGIPPAVSAIRAVVSFAEVSRKVLPSRPAAPESSIPLTDAELVTALSARGLPAPESAVAETIEAAVAAADRIGYPVALKGVSPQMIHKSDFGIVHLDLDSAAAVTMAGEDIRRKVESSSSASHLQGLLVQKMVSGLEVILGARVDPQFGPYVVLGLGGVLVEIMQDVAVRLLPVNRSEARDMVMSLRGSRLFGAYRGRSARDVDALVEAIVRMTDLFVEHQHWLSDLEINPLMVFAEGQGVCAVDVRAIRRDR